MDVPYKRSYWVEPGRLLAGYYPGSRDGAEVRRKLGLLLDTGIRTWINLIEPAEIHPENGQPFVHYDGLLAELARARGVDAAYHRFPIRDTDTTSTARMTEVLNTIDQALDAGKPVYVHCWLGQGRTGTTVACYLLRHGLADASHVLAKLQALRAADCIAHLPSPETERQRQFVLRWQRGQ